MLLRILSLLILYRIKHFLNLPHNPLFLTLALTYSCQSRCQNCHIWKIYQNNPKLKDHELSNKDWYIFFQKSGDSVIHLNITGGEPFLKKDLAEFVKITTRYLNNLNSISINTNGYLTSEMVSQTKQILKSFKGHLSIGVSLDGTEKLHDKIRGLSQSYDHTIQTFLALKDISRKFPNLHVSFSYTFSDLNIGQFEDFFKDIKKKIPYISSDNIGLNLCHKGLLYQNQSLSRNINLVKLQKDLDFIKKENKSVFTINPYKLLRRMIRNFYLASATSYLKGRKFPCAAGSASYFIDPYGNIYPCIIWNKKLGNLKNFDFKKKYHPLSQKCPGCFTQCEIQNAYFLNLPFSLSA